MKEEKKVSRRQFIQSAAIMGAAAMVLPSTVVGGKADVKKAVARATGGKRARKGRVKLITPVIAENGAVVPITVRVKSPMKKGDYVKALTILIDKNPVPRVVSVNFSPGNGRAYFSARMRMAKTSRVRAYAKMSNGSVFVASKSIKVTIGGCG